MNNIKSLKEQQINNNIRIVKRRKLRPHIESTESVNLNETDNYESMDIDNNNDNDDEVADTTSAQIASLAPVSLRQLNESEFGSFSGEIIASSQEGKIIIENEDQANSKESGFSKQSEISLDDIQFPSDLSKDYHPLVNDNDYYYLTNNEEDESQIISEEEGASSTHQSKKQKIKQKVDNLFSNTQTTPLNVSHDDFRVAVFKAGHNLLKNQFTLSTAQELNTNETSPTSFGEHMDHLAHHLITILRELLKLPINQEKKNDLFALGMDWCLRLCLCCERDK